MPVGDTYVAGFEEIPLTHELGAKQWLRENDAEAYARLQSLLNNPDNEDQRETTIAFMQDLGWVRVCEEEEG